MKSRLKDLVAAAISSLQQNGVLPTELDPNIQVERTRDSSHGDFACNIAMLLAKPARAKPRDLAEKIVAAIPPSNEVEKVEIAGPGFINFFLKPEAITAVIPAILEAGKAFGCNEWQLLFKIQIPLALPAIMTGVNQTVMMALSMVVIAAMIGAGGLGNPILFAIQRVDLGMGVEAGFGILFTAIILDRILQGYSAKQRKARHL